MSLGEGHARDDVGVLFQRVVGRNMGAKTLGGGNHMLPRRVWSSMLTPNDSQVLHACDFL